MAKEQDFLNQIESKVLQQLRSQNVGFLLGAGASYLDGQGYPLAANIWSRINGNLEKAERDSIQAKLDMGSDGLEQALDLLDEGNHDGMPLRYKIAKLIGDDFRTINSPLVIHREFVKALARTRLYSVHIFCLNYDPLIERAAEEEGIRVIDGFVGTEHSFFDPSVFQQCAGLPGRKRGGLICNRLRGIIKIYKLHGSIGWYQCDSRGIRRCAFATGIPTGTKPLMIPPQQRKANDTTFPPYSNIWSEFRRLLSHGPEYLNRLVMIGYGIRDEHINAVIEGALARKDFTLLILTKELRDIDFNRWSKKQNVIIVTEARSSLYGQTGHGHDNLWTLKRITQEIS
jgi:hypothetical protein